MQGSQDQWQAEVQDISLTGLRMELDRRFEAGTVLTLEILNEKGEVLARSEGLFIAIDPHRMFARFVER